MCTFENNPELKRPEAEEVTIYKVFDKAKFEETAVPISFCGAANFKFGWNKWDKKRAKKDGQEQSGFQAFANLEDAQRYACWDDLAIPITILTKDIVKMTDAFGKYGKVYEVKAFAIWKKDWNIKRQKYWNEEKER